MARLPDVTAQRPAPRPTRAIASISPGAASAVADAYSDAGRAAQQIGLEVEDREATARGKEADTRAAEEIRDLIHNPETGFANARGGDAVGRYKAVNERLDTVMDRATEGLDERAKKKARDSIMGRVERAKGTVDSHTGNERTTWINGASQARIESLYQDALIDISATESSISGIEGEFRGQAGRDGWSAEKLANETAQARSKLLAGQAERIAIKDPVAAMEYVEANRGRMVATDLASLEGGIGKQARRAAGEARAESAYNRRGMTGTAQGALATLEQMTGQTFNVNSAYRDAGHNAAVGGAKGSQHIKGNAFDIDVRGKSKEERTALIRAARQAGFGGVGVYANALHFDVGPTRAWGADYKGRSVPEWAMDAVGSPRGAVAAGQGGETQADLAMIADPLERDGAQARYRELGAADAGRRKIFEAEMDEAIAYAEQNGTTPSLSVFDPGIVDSLYDVSEADEIKRRYEQGLADAEVMHGVATATEGQLAAQVAAAVDAVSAPGRTDEDVARRDGLFSAIERRNKAVVEDAAGYAQRAFGETGGAFSAYASAEPDARAAAAQNYVAALDFNYTRIGVPRDMQSVLPKPAAAAFAKQFNEMPRDEVAPQLATFAAEWGDASPRVLRDLTAAGLAPEAALAMNHVDNPGLAAEIVSVSGMTTDDLIKGVDKIKVTAAITGWDETVAPFREVFEKGDLTGEATRTMNETGEVAKRMVLKRVRGGMDEAKAVEDVFDAMFPQTVVDEPNAQLILPQGDDPAVVSNMLGRWRGDEILRAFNPAPMNIPGMQDFAQREGMLDAAKNGVWLTNSMGDGAVLHLDVGGYLIPVVDDYGREHEVLFGAATASDRIVTGRFGTGAGSIR